MPDNITFTCPQCFILLSVPTELAGITGPCPSCSGMISSPTATTEPVDLRQFPSASDQSPGIERTNSPADNTAAQSQKDQSKFPEKPTTAEDYQETDSAIPTTHRESINWRQAVTNALIGFVFVVALAIATYCIAMTIERNSRIDIYENLSIFKVITQDTSPLNAETNSLPHTNISEDGNITEGNTVFPIVNSVEPPTLHSLPVPAE